jgi:hypothetical protein
LNVHKRRIFIYLLRSFWLLVLFYLVRIEGLVLREGGGLLVWWIGDILRWLVFWGVLQVRRWNFILCLGIRIVVLLLRFCFCFSIVENLWNSSLLFRFLFRLVCVVLLFRHLRGHRLKILNQSVLRNLLLILFRFLNFLFILWFSWILIFRVYFSIFIRDHWKWYLEGRFIFYLWGVRYCWIILIVDSFILLLAFLIFWTCFYGIIWPKNHFFSLFLCRL